jgi:hypothetical protein
MVRCFYCRKYKRNGNNLVIDGVIEGYVKKERNFSALYIKTAEGDQLYAKSNNDVELYLMAYDFGDPLPWFAWKRERDVIKSKPFNSWQEVVEKSNACN